MDNTHFALAAKSKLRFSTTRGQLSTEDLYDLSLKDLDRLAVAIDGEIGTDRKTFLANPDSTPVSKARVENELRLEILKAVIEDKQADNAAKKAAAEKKSRVAFLENLREKKEIDKLETLSIEEIDAQLAALKS